MWQPQGELKTLLVKALFSLKAREAHGMAKLYFRKFFLIGVSDLPLTRVLDMAVRHHPHSTVKNATERFLKEQSHRMLTGQTRCRLHLFMVMNTPR